MADNETERQKLVYFQEITGVKDSTLSHHVLDAYGWDLDSAIHAMVDKNTNTIPEYEESMRGGHTSTTVEQQQSGSTSSAVPEQLVQEEEQQQESSHGVLRLTGVPSLAVEAANSTAIVPVVPTGAAEAVNFLRAYEKRFGEFHPEFQAVSFMEALRRAGQEFKFLFVYLHAPQHINTPVFCETTLRNEAAVDFINANFIAWGADIHKTEGYQMSNSLSATTYPFCAIVLGSTEQHFSVVKQVEGFRTAEELMSILQNVIEDQSDSLIAGRREQNARNLNSRLREEQDEAYRVGLHADQERERREQQVEHQAARDRGDAEKRRAQDEKDAAQAAYLLARKEENLAQLRRDKALNLGPEPEGGGADVTHVAVRLPSGERKDRRFINSTKVQALYDYIDSLNSFTAPSFLLISNFPRVVYGPDKLDLTLKDAGLHPRTSLFVQLEDL